jgi:hypothetical protein
MVILEVVGWFILSCVLMSFIEHQVHSRLMHRKNYLSEHTTVFKRIFESHAMVHHGHYSSQYTDEPVPAGEDKEIRLNPGRGIIKALPFALAIAVLSRVGAVVFILTVVFHHWTWNKIHLEMHKPEGRGFSKWPIYKFLARYHYLHHCHPGKNFNVVFPLADYVLGTQSRPATIKETEAMQALGLYLSGAAQIETAKAIAQVK